MRRLYQVWVNRWTDEYHVALVERGKIVAVSAGSPDPPRASTMHHLVLLRDPLEFPKASHPKWRLIRLSMF